MSNFFNVLKNDSDDETAQTQPNAQKKKKRDPNKETKQQREERERREKLQAEEVARQSNQREKKPREGPKQKGVASEPHPLDRQSGTGRGKELRKGGGGQRNWGTYKDDLKEEKYLDASDAKQKKKREQGTEEGAEENPEQAENVEEKQEEKEQPQAKTLQEYYDSIGYDPNQPKQQEKKVAEKPKVSQEFLKKENLREVVTKEDIKREQQQKEPKKAVATSSASNYNAAMNTQGAEYLGFNASVNKATDGHKQQRKQKENKGFVLNDQDFPSL